ncbi:MAG: DUF2007 domain-containing protein [Phycisphaerae bacterium]|nr:DUF2007 domain-containing protein [Phycisphaerae bacterium]
MEDKLITVAQFDTAFDAELAKMRLENDGIAAIVVGDSLVANMYTIEAIKVHLLVFERDADRARSLLANPPDEELRYDSDEDMDEDVDEDFDGDGNDQLQ